MMANPKPIKRKQFSLDANVLYALEALARDNGDSLDQLADIAFRDLLKKLRRPVSLQEALQVSARTLPANDREPKRPRVKA
jgi:hypothetical protein